MVFHCCGALPNHLGIDIVVVRVFPLDEQGTHTFRMERFQCQILAGAAIAASRAEQLAFVGMAVLSMETICDKFAQW